MKDKHDKVTADLFEMSDTDILKWVEKYVTTLEVHQSGGMYMV